MLDVGTYKQTLIKQLNAAVKAHGSAVRGTTALGKVVRHTIRIPSPSQVLQDVLYYWVYDLSQELSEIHRGVSLETIAVESLDTKHLDIKLLMPNLPGS